MMNKEQMRSWCKELIHGTGGFKSFEDHKIPVFFKEHNIPVFSDRDVAIVEFTIKALANLRCKDAAEVLAAAKVAVPKEANADNAPTS